MPDNTPPRPQDVGGSDYDEKLWASLYLDTVNHPNFREAGQKVHEAEKLLAAMGMSREQAWGWIHAWASGAGDGAE